MNILLRCDIMKKLCEMGERIERTLVEDQGSVDFGIANHRNCIYFVIDADV